MNKFQTLRYISYGLELLLALILQNTPFLLPEVFGGRPVLLVAVALTVAMFEPSCTAAMWVGVAAGLLADYGYSGAIGFFALMLAVLCYFSNIIMNDYIKTNLLTAMLVSAVCIILIFGLHFLFFYVLFGYTDTGYFFVNHYLSRMIYTAAFVPVFFALNRFLTSKLT